jgi:hypothetical protein
LVVQTGAEFGDAVVHDYEAENARMLAANLPANRVIFERRAATEAHLVILAMNPTVRPRESVGAEESQNLPEQC